MVLLILGAAVALASDSSTDSNCALNRKKAEQAASKAASLAIARQGWHEIWCRHGIAYTEAMMQAKLDMESSLIESREAYRTRHCY